MRLLTRNWWRAVLVGVFLTFIMAGSPLTHTAEAKCIIFCNHNKPDPAVDQSVKPGPEFYKLPKKGQKFWHQQCFNKAYEGILRRGKECAKYFPGYTWKDPEQDWSLQETLDPAHQAGKVVSAAAGSVVGGWVHDGIVSVTHDAADTVSSFLKDEIKLIRNSTTPAFNLRWWVTLYGEIFGIAFLIAIAAVAYRITKSAAPNQDSAEIVKGPIALIAFGVLGVFLPAFFAGLVILNDKVLAPGFMGASTEQTDKIIHQLTNNLDNLTSVGIAWLGMLIILLAGAVGGVIVEFMLYVRELMLYVLVPVEVIALALWAGGEKLKGLLVVVTSALLGWTFLPSIMSAITYISVRLIGSNQDANPAILGSLALLGMPIIASWLTFWLTNVDLWEHTKTTGGKVREATKTVVKQVST